MIVMWIDTELTDLDRRYRFFDPIDRFRDRSVGFFADIENDRLSRQFIDMPATVLNYIQYSISIHINRRIIRETGRINCVIGFVSHRSQIRFRRKFCRSIFSGPDQSIHIIIDRGFFHRISVYGHCTGDMDFPGVIIRFCGKDIYRNRCFFRDPQF